MGWIVYFNRTEHGHKQFEGIEKHLEPPRTSNLVEPDYHMNRNPTRATRGARIADGRS